MQQGVLSQPISRPCTAFFGLRKLSAGPLAKVALEVKRAAEAEVESTVLVFDDITGRVIDIDTRGTDYDVVARLEAAGFRPEASEAAQEPRGRGRPKLGVIAREVTLLPRHWDWLNSQPGGASVALRKLVEEARRTSGDADRRRTTQEAAYNFMSAMAGNLPGFEEAARALFAYDRRRFGDVIARWPEDVRDHSIRLAFADLEPPE
jgi:hypothetical protein